MMLVLPDASRMGYRLRLTNYFLTTMTRQTRCVTVAVGATVRTARQLIHPVREDMLFHELEPEFPGRRLAQSPESLKSSTIETDSPFIENKHEGLS